jgi:hypothetical protein
VDRLDESGLGELWSWVMTLVFTYLFFPEMGSTPLISIVGYIGGGIELLYQSCS